jgi:hypothetical protein
MSFHDVIQGWAYAQSYPQTKTMIQDSGERQLASYRKAAKRWVSRAKVDTVARALAGAVIGYVVQSVSADTEIDPATYCEGLALLSVDLEGDFYRRAFRSDQLKLVGHDCRPARPDTAHSAVAQTIARRRLGLS